MKKSSFKRSLAMFLAILMLVTSFPIVAFATTEKDFMPSIEDTLAQPFVKNNPSEIYRIPGIVTMDDGTLVAVADARWNGGMDGGGNDTIIARSSDGGTTWKHTMTNYYPDNGNVFNKASTGVCDSEIATDGETLYLLTTFFPAGWALNGSSANNQINNENGTAFVTLKDENGNDKDYVKLALNGSSSYDYYVGDFDKAGADGRAPILKISDGSATGYSVDHDYYLYRNGVKDGNLFYSDGYYQTAKVNFLLFRTSTDKGETWSDFTPLNMKNSSEAFFGVGPGRGIAYPDGRIYFSTYTWSTHWLGANDTQRSSFIFSDDGGKTWTRTPNVGALPSGLGDAGATTNTKWTSESQLVHLNDETMLLFVRNAWGKVIYFKATLNDDGSFSSWSGRIDTEIKTCNNSGCQLSAIKYSKQLQYNGNYYTAVFVSSPSTNSRTAGKIHTLLFDKDGNCVNMGSKNANNNRAISYEISSSGVYYGYSCMTEMNNGQVALLYEIDAAKGINFTTFDPVTVSGCRLPDNLPHTYTVDIPKGESKTFYVDSNVTDIFDTNTGEKNPDYITTLFSNRDGVNIHLGDSAEYAGVTIAGKNALYDFNKNTDGTWTIYSQGVYLSILERGIPSSAKAAKVKILTYNKDGKNYFQLIDERGEALCFYRSSGGNGSIYTYDLSTAYGNDGAVGSSSVAVDRDRDISLFELFRLLKPGETAEANEIIPGYVRINDVNEIKNGSQYLIGCQAGENYYVLYPSTSRTNTYSHSAKVGAKTDSGFFMTVNAEVKGSATIKVGLDTYIINVVDYSNEILGVVDYDPVIYTHGNPSEEMGHTLLGKFIADGTYEGEKETHFRLTDAAKGKYDIVSIQPLTAPNADGEINPISGAEISFDFNTQNNDGLLHGMLPLCDSNEGKTKKYQNYDEGEYVTIKTVVVDLETHEQYTQTDRLYVASNPVAGHIAVAQSVNSKSNLLSYVLANNSYGNTNNINASEFNAGYKYNVLRMYSKYFENSNGVIKNKLSDPVCYGENDVWSINSFEQVNDQAKRAGALSIETSGTYGRPNIVEQFPLSGSSDAQNTTATPVAYYYYDLSSPKNEGIVNPKLNSDGTGSDFSVQMSRMASSVYNLGNGNWNGTMLIDYGNAEWTTGTWPNKMTHKYSKDSYIRQFSSTTSDATIDEQTLMFGNKGDTFVYSDYGTIQKTVDVNCHIKNLTPNSTQNLKGLLNYSQMADSGNNSARTIIALPFEIIFCNKSAEREAYKNTVKEVLKSTDYTTTTWKAYMDSVLVYQEYLNNYTLTSTAAKVGDSEKSYAELIKDVGTVNGEYDVIQKSARFDDLKKVLDDNASKYDTLLTAPDGKSYTPSSFMDFDATYKDAQNYYNTTYYTDLGYNTQYDLYRGLTGSTLTDDAIKRSYGDDGIRSEVPGWEAGPYNTTKLKTQVDIEDKTAAVVNTLKLAGDDTAYLAAKSESNNIDKTAYTNPDDIDTIQQKFDECDAVLYAPFELDGVYYGNFLDVTEDEQSKIDFNTAKALENMEVAKTKNNLRQYQVTFNVNGENVYTVMKNYGDIQPLDLSTYMTGDNVVKCVVNTDDHETSGKVDTTVNVEDYAGMGYVIPVLVQQNITIDVTCKPKNEAKQVVVVDYYGTVTGILYAVDDTDRLVVDSNAVWLTSNPDVKVYVKTSPKYEFTGWSLELGNYSVTEPITIVQRGNLNPMVHEFTAENGKINSQGTFISNSPNSKLTLESETGKYWTRKVNGMTMLASYESSFVNFSSNEDVVYTAYDSIDAMKAANVDSNILNTAEKGTPVVYGTGYYVNNMFTMSVDYSAPANSTNIKVLDAGVIYSTSDLSEDGLVKGAANTRTVTANRIAHWTNNANSGTFTITKHNAEQGTYYMRAYVSYSATYVGIDENGKPKEYTLPYVAYSPVIYKCVNGNVEIAG